MNFIEKYHENISKYEKKHYIGYYPYRVKPISRNAEVIFAKIIKVEVKDANYSSLWKLLDWHDSDRTVKKYLNEENMKKSKFYGKVNMFYIDGSIAEKEFIRENIMKKFKKEYGLSSDSDFKVEIDEFVHYPEVKKMSFDDISDLMGIKEK